MGWAGMQHLDVNLLWAQVVGRSSRHLVKILRTGGHPGGAGRQCDSLRAKASGFSGFPAAQRPTATGYKRSHHCASSHGIHINLFALSGTSDLPRTSDLRPFPFPSSAFPAQRSAGAKPQTPQRPTRESSSSVSSNRGRRRSRHVEEGTPSQTAARPGGHEWTKFEMDAVLALAMQGAHTSRDPLKFAVAQSRPQRQKGLPADYRCQRRQRPTCHHPPDQARRPQADRAPADLSHHASPEASFPSWPERRRECGRVDRRRMREKLRRHGGVATRKASAPSARKGGGHVGLDYGRRTQEEDERLLVLA